MYLVIRIIIIIRIKNDHEIQESVMSVLSESASARMLFTINWQSNGINHVEHYYAAAINMWQDIFPQVVRDIVFYSEPRMVSHIDRQASRHLTSIISGRLRPGDNVLDLMASIDSHLPVTPDFNVTGLGMNN